MATVFLVLHPLDTLSSYMLGVVYDDLPNTFLFFNLLLSRLDT